MSNILLQSSSAALLIGVVVLKETRRRTCSNTMTSGTTWNTPQVMCIFSEYTQGFVIQ